jgi:hypothetical protein
VDNLVRNPCCASLSYEIENCSIHLTVPSFLVLHEIMEARPSIQRRTLALLVVNLCPAAVVPGCAAYDFVSLSRHNGTVPKTL